MIILVWLSLALSLLLLILFPFIFSQVMIESLGKLHLGPSVAAMIVVAVFLGGLVNIPITRITREDEVLIHPLAVFGLRGFLPALRRVRRHTVVAVNAGGCLIPTGLALYEAAYLARFIPDALWAAAAASAISIAVCYAAARPMRGVGIVIPGFVPALVATGAALLFAPDQAPPVAFIAGVLGPLIGADVMHLREVSKLGAGVISIGGAGTFDGIVLSGILAAYLA